MKDLVDSLPGVPETEQRKLIGIMVRTEIPRGGLFIQEGNVPQKFGFVSRGLFRYFYTSKEGAEFTKGFFQEKAFIAAYSAMVNQTGSYYAIEALEDSVVYVVDYRKWIDLYKGNTCWSALLITLLEKGYMKKERREREFLLLDAEDRYKAFLTEYPELESRIKQHMVASYLGITPVALSRIRAKIKSEIPPVVNIG